jgi:hypothetical protein
MSCNAHCTVNHRSQNQHSKPWSWADRDCDCNTNLLSIACFPVHRLHACLIARHSSPSIRNTRNCHSTPLSPPTNHARSSSPRVNPRLAASAQVKVHDHAIALFNRPPSPRTQTNWQKAHPSAASPSCHRAGSAKHRLSGWLPTTALVTPRRETCLSNDPDPPISRLQSKSDGKECFKCRECLTAWRRDAMRPPAQHNTTQHSTATPLNSPRPDSGYCPPFFFFSSCSEKKVGFPDAE